ncbi:Hypothetical predicted protein [Olea europaea subsp. europaea]|uniref:DUF1985 domain-containing protein n=1 Tax=Olea europaea subsp. europaea TaxID=158383 RepID=A0A8S0PPE6_OLEEU|nr:Hypothetical predicted protein [Olea europaea subsp. europaea]
MDNFDNRLRADFCDSCLGFLANVPEIQFFAQLIQALGHLTRFGLQEYAIVTGLHVGSFPEGDRYTKALEKRRLKEKYFKLVEKISCAQLEKAILCASTLRADRYKLGLALIVEGVITAPDNNVGIDEDTLAIVDDLELFFAIRPCLHSVWTDINVTFVLLSSRQIWAYEAMPELDECFGERVGERSPQLLCWTSTKQPQQRIYDAFFREVQLHVHTTLRPTEAERDLPYIASLVPFPNRPVQFLDDLARRVVGPQFHGAAPASGGDNGSDTGDGHDDESGAGAEDVDKSTRDGHHTPEGNGDDGSKPNDSRESGRDPSSEIGGSDSEKEVDASGRQSGALPTPVVAPSTSGVQGTRDGATLTRKDVEGMLYDQRILFEMRLRTVKLEIMQHVTEEFARLRDFISTLVPPSSGTSTSTAAPVVNESNIWDDPHEDVYGGEMDLCLDDGGRPSPMGNLDVNDGQGSDVRSTHDDDCADEAEMQEGNAGEGSDKWSTHDDDHADEGEMHAVNDGEGGDELSTEDDDRTEEGDMQDMNDPGKTVPPSPTTTTRKAHRPMTSRR